VSFQSGGGFTFIARRSASRGGKEHCNGGSCFALLTNPLNHKTPDFQWFFISKKTVGTQATNEHILPR
jgi:hypothetical protein